MPLGSPIIRKRTLLDRLREALTPTPSPRVVTEFYARNGALLDVLGNGTTVLLTDRAPSTRPLFLKAYYVFADDPVAKEFVTIRIAVNGVSVFPSSGSSLWKLFGAQPIQIEVTVPPAATWSLEAINSSGTPGFPQATTVQLQASLIGEVLHA